MAIGRELREKRRKALADARERLGLRPDSQQVVFKDGHIVWADSGQPIDDSPHLPKTSRDKTPRRPSYRFRWGND